MSKRNTFIVKEILNVRYIYIAVVLIIDIILLIFGLFNKEILSFKTFYDYTKSALVICLSFMCSEIIYGQGDLNIVFSSVKSKFEYVFTKYLINLITILLLFFVLSLLQILLIIILNDVISQNVWRDGVYIFIDLIPTFIFSSTLVLFASLMLRSKLVAYGISFFLPPAQMTTATALINNNISNYWWFITSFDTINIDNTKVWCFNKLLYLMIAILLWIFIYFELKYSRRDIVGND